jgi:hypothetical protein
VSEWLIAVLELLAADGEAPCLPSLVLARPPATHRQAGASAEAGDGSGSAAMHVDVPALSTDGGGGGGLRLTVGGPGANRPPPLKEQASVRKPCGKEVALFNVGFRQMLSFCLTPNPAKA